MHVACLLRRHGSRTGPTSSFQETSRRCLLKNGPLLRIGFGHWGFSECDIKTRYQKCIDTVPSLLHEKRRFDPHNLVSLRLLMRFVLLFLKICFASLESHPGHGLPTCGGGRAPARCRRGSADCVELER